MATMRFFTGLRAREYPLAKTVTREGTACVRRLQAVLSADELDGHEVELALGPFAQHACVHLGADQLADHQLLDVVHCLDRGAVQLDDQVFGPEACAGGGAFLDDFHDLNAALAPEPCRDARRQRPRAARDTQVRAPKAPLRHQRGDDRARRLVDRNGEAEADTRYGRVDADHAASAVGERPAGVARIEGRVGLDHVVDDTSAARRERAADGGDDPGRDRAGEPVWIAYRHDQLPYLQALGVAELGRAQVAGARP